MGGIAGIVRFDGQEPNQGDLNSMKLLLGHRGAPNTYQVGNGFLLSFGGSIENGVASMSCVSDASLYSTLFPFDPFCNTVRQLGPESLNEINGDFAAVIWDQAKKQVCCGRDVMGVRPLYYVHIPGRFFAFASEIKALKAIGEVLVVPNKSKFREYLTWPGAYMPYEAETFYKSVYSVLPGHYLKVDSSKVEEYPYWQVDPHKFGNLRHPGDYADVFRDYFTSAVEVRIRNKKSVASHLSGGLDSSSVSGVAQSLLNQQQRPALNTFYIDTKERFANEELYVQAVVNKWNTDHHRVEPLSDLMASVQKINRMFDRPEHFIIPSSFHLAVSQKAQDLACDILLTGHDGDSIIPIGYDYLDTLLSASQWENFRSSAKKFVIPKGRNLYFLTEKWHGLSDERKFERYMLYAMANNVKKHLRARPVYAWPSLIREQKRHFEVSGTSMLFYFLEKARNRLVYNNIVEKLISKDFNTTNLGSVSSGRMGLGLSHGGAGAQYQLHHTTNIICNEQMNHIGAYYGHEYSFPFFDRNVIEIGLFTPQKVHFNQGLGRGLIRHGMKEFLPTSVSSRISKANFVEYGTYAAQQLYNASRDQFALSGNPIWEIVDRPAFFNLVKFVFNSRVPVIRKGKYNFLLSRIIYLSIWLNDSKEPGAAI